MTDETNQPGPKRLMDIKEVARYLGVSVRTVQTYLAEEDDNLRLTGIKMGGKWKFENSDVEDFIVRLRQHSRPKSKRLAEAA